MQGFVRVAIAALCDLLSVVECGGSQGGCILIIIFNLLFFSGGTQIYAGPSTIHHVPL